MSAFKPELFQGYLRKKRYFEGWYFKHITSDIDNVYSFIPGISLAADHPHSFIQVIDGISGKSDYVEYSPDEFTLDRRRFLLKVGNSSFSGNHIDLNIRNDSLRITGHINYSNLVKYPESFLSPGIMGWYSYVPFMECKHGIISVNHDLSGDISVNGKSIDFSNGKGYIEKDWGVSFPEAWIWIQCNNFQNKTTSFSFSIAKIPWLGKFFIGFISFLYYNERFFLFSSYNRSSVSEIKQEGNSLSLKLLNKTNILKVNVVRNSFGDLLAPANGQMSRKIKESIDSNVYFELFDKFENLIYRDYGKRAGLELIDKIFNYI